MRASLIVFSLALLLAALLPAGSARADELEIVISGVGGALLENVEARTQSFRITGNTRLSQRRLQQMAGDAERRAAAALRPYGHYHAVVDSRIRSTGDQAWELALDIDPGPPVRVADHRVEVVGPGSGDAIFQQWQAAWPLTGGGVLDQAVWEERKTVALDLAEAHGYLSAAFSVQRIEVDLERNTANLALTLDTGEQALMGSVVFRQDIVRDGILESLPRFEPGQPYDAWLLEQFRLDLWRIGYFESIEVLEERRLDETPPTVDLVVNLEPRNLNTYQGSVGYGSDTGFRVQAMWNRHLLTSRGDSLDAGFGWQQKGNEFNLRTGYRIPRKVSARQYWTAELLYRTEKQTFEVFPLDDPEELRIVARGNVDDYSFRPGWLRIRGLRRGYHQIFEHWYVQFLHENISFEPVDDLPEPSRGPLTGPVAGTAFDNSESASVGVNLHWPAVRGSGFETVGHNHRAWAFTSNTAWGSDLDFSQVYLNTRWNTIWKDRWKFLVRGEVGYSDAEVRDRLVEVGGDVFELSVTELPFAYRFKAGGSQSVRGYGFEDLSNNNIGSNNIVTASAELEFRFRESWSAAAFVDIGNAFNDWSDMDLKTGVGVGIRWYSIAGPIRLDVAQALDEPGKPWRFHFTIGTPLL